MDPADFYFFNHKKGRSINQLVQFANVLIIVFKKKWFYWKHLLDIMYIFIYTFYKNWMHYSKKSPYKRLHSYAIYISKI